MKIEEAMGKRCLRKMRGRRFSSIAFAASAIALIALSTGAGTILRTLDPVAGIWGSILTADLPAEGTVRLKGLKMPVYVYRDRWGVPHIFAEDEGDLFYAFGYVQAQDRLWQMDVARRLARGRLSELFGPSTYSVDVFQRVIGLERGARSAYEVLTEELKGVLSRFSDGVNAYITEVNSNRLLLPLEYRLLGVKPEAWEPLDTLSIGRLIEWGLVGSFNDLKMGLLLKAIGPEGLRELGLIDRPLNRPVLGSGAGAQRLPPSSWGQGAYDASHILDWGEALEPLLEYVGLRGGFSNNWVLAGSKTVTGKPILANDPHLSHTAPPIWYEAHLVVKGGLNVRGVTFPGIPVIIIGRNDRVAWGFTNAMADVIDFYFYAFDESGSRYWYIDRWEEVRREKEIIKVREGGALVDRAISINFTRHGPLVERYGQRFAFKWMGHGPTRELLALYLYNRARNIAEFGWAVQFFDIPPQNTIYADVEGNIAYWAAGRYPVRAGHPYLPANGSRGELEWRGFIPFPEIPHIVNPASGFIATANGKVAGADYPHYIGYEWASRYRYDRIVELITSKEKLSVEDVVRIQNDIHVIFARYAVPLILSSVKASPEALSDPIALHAIEALARWDYEASKDSVAMTVFDGWVRAMQRRVWGPIFELAGLKGEEEGVPLEILEYILINNMTRWLGGPREAVVARAFAEAVDDLKKALGDELSRWRWGSRHYYAINHAMGEVVGWLNYPREEAEGWQDTVNPAGGLEVKSGASWRQIIDFSDLDSSLSVIPGGQRGHRFSMNWADQLPLWMRGEYKVMDAPPTPERVKGPVRVLKLEPAR